MSRSGGPENDLPLTGGFQDPPPRSSSDAADGQASRPGNLAKGIQELGDEALQRLQGHPDVSDGEGREQGLSDGAHLDSGGAASKSDPGSRDFRLKSGGDEEPARGPGQGGGAEASTSGRQEQPGAA